MTERVESDIYASSEVERIAQSGTTRAEVYADEFTRLAGIVPEMTGDRESMLSWFAIAIEAGRTAGEQTVADSSREILYRFAEWIERDRREPDKLLCLVLSMRREAQQIDPPST